jgi:hypothetical protein
MAEGNGEPDDEGCWGLVVGLVGVDDSVDDDHQHEAEEELDAQTLGDGHVPLEGGVAEATLVRLRGQRLETEGGSDC